MVRSTSQAPGAEQAYGPTGSMARLGRRAAPFAEHAAEAGTACLLAMVQGNVLLLGVSHWIIATQTGVLAATLSVAALFLTRAQARWAVALLLGLATAVVDFVVHEGGFGPAFLEALVTGACAGALSFAVGTLLHGWRARRNGCAAV